MIGSIMGYLKRPVPGQRIVTCVLSLTFCFYTVFLYIPVAAQEENTVLMEVKAGFSNTYKEGRWFPVRVTLENNGPGIEGVIEVQFTDSGPESSNYLYPIELPSVSRKEVTVYVYPKTSYATILEVRLVQNGRELIQKSITMHRANASDAVYGIIATYPSAFNILSTLDPMNGSARVVEIEAADLPELVQGYGPLDSLVLSNADTGSLNTQQLEALAAWITQGGRLLITGGPDWEKTTIPLKPTGLLPLNPERSVTLNRIETAAALEQIQIYTGNAQSILSQDSLILSVGTPTDHSEMLVGSEDIPLNSLISHKIHGAGQVIFFAFDPSIAPFRSWTGAEVLYRNLFFTTLPEPGWGNGILDWQMAGQAAQTMPSLGLPSIVLICGFLVLYVLILGPVNFILLRRIKRRELGWITIPGFVLLFSAIVLLGGSFSRGQKPILHRLSIVQTWSSQVFARVDGVVGVYSPNRAMYEVVAANPTTFHAIPDSGLLQSESPTIIETSQEVSVPEVRVDVGGIYPLAYQSTISGPAFSHDLVYVVDEEGINLEGSLENLSNLNLLDAVLLTQSGVVEIGDISSGSKMLVEKNLDIAQIGKPAVGPVTSFPGSSFSPPPTMYMGGNTIEEILGTFDYYSNRDTYRKYALLVGAMSYSPPSIGPTNEVYLVGWSEVPVVDIELAETKANFEDLSLYIIGIQPAIDYRGDRWTLSPGFFDWRSLDPLQRDISPYQQYLYAPGKVAFSFEPRQTLAFESIDSLILHLNSSYESGPVQNVVVSLWNFQSQDWESLGDIEWGDIEISNPERYVAFEAGSDILGRYAPGTIRLQIENFRDSLEIEKSDFSIVVNR